MMIGPDTERQIVNALHAGVLSRREISRQLRVSRGTVDDIARGCRPADKSLQKAQTSPKWLPGQRRRCPRCGRLTHPRRLGNLHFRCLACGVEATRPPLLIVVDEDGPPRLQLRRVHYQRYLQVRALRDQNALSLGVDVDPPPPPYDPPLRSATSGRILAKIGSILKGRSKSLASRRAPSRSLLFSSSASSSQFVARRLEPAPLRQACCLRQLDHPLSQSSRGNTSRGNDLVPSPLLWGTRYRVTLSKAVAEILGQFSELTVQPVNYAADGGKVRA